ncbi:MAG: hypothetical protein COV91_06110 [Candidatus Taylorbacteria bacterium CG11_big_fil_rev_8_21_14_0_20_46_11]|uniref:Plasmid stabilization protein n=1 Tax=Candidatus Taylorbacteria bacterium CG11_big_fil_rev_8_21_14_0_20_46_11 TaxID=1975025 RepID=A0A2H0K9Y2_9BACT|nr:MAG: hypothetical protein COV91_06110 [Candidatus Taylorbacteria bacterium CG11_big_fil_rev_8_21_14_0_20_46_11]
MDWAISLSRQAEKFLARNHIVDAFVTEQILKALRKFSGKIVALDIRQMTGVWSGHFRIRSGKIRLIFSVDFYEKKVLVEVVDFRGNVYK